MAISEQFIVCVTYFSSAGSLLWNADVLFCFGRCLVFKINLKNKSPLVYLNAYRERGYPVKIDAREGGFRGDGGMRESC